MSIVRDAQRVLAALLFVLVLGLAATGWVNQKRADRAQESYQVAAGTARAATVYVREYKAVKAAQEAKNAEVEETLQVHSDWRDDPVPDDVAGLLRHSTGTTRAVP